MNYHNNLNKLSKFLIYGISFIIIFNFIFEKYVTDSSQTSGMFVIISFILTGGAILTYLLLIWLLKRRTNSISNFLDALLMYFAFEIVAMIIIEPGSLWGIKYIFHLYNEQLEPEILKFRINRDIALSASSLASAIIYFIAAQLSPKKPSQIS